MSDVLDDCVELVVSIVVRLDVGRINHQELFNLDILIVLERPGLFRH